jgi:4-diphosphocytidyl-2-C-methyl-D-erythritol kinase
MFAHMIRFPKAKINLGLQVLRLRPDGYRDIASVMLAVPLHDALEIMVDPELPDGEFLFERTGLPVPGDARTDLVVRAAGLIGEHGRVPGMRAHLHKAIPIGAGLGGGSSDGAHALRMVAELAGIALEPATLAGLAARLGSDCAFFLDEGVQLATGRGEVLRPLDLDLRGWWIHLVNPGIHVSTAEVYAHTPARAPARDLASIVSREPVECWQQHLVNDLEPYVLRAYPAVAQLKEEVLANGAVYGAMSGSGSTVFGLHRQEPRPLAERPGQRQWILPL